MTTRIFALSLLAASAGWSATGCGSASATEEPIAQREAIELTVYADDFAVVKESRPFALEKGRNKLRLIDVSKQLDQHSVMFDWGKDGSKAEVVSNTYDLGVGGSEGLLKRFLGREVELVTYGENGREAERIKCVLEVADPGNVVIRANGKYLINPPGTIVAPSDTGIVTIPQLTAEVDAPAAQGGDLDVTYLTRGLSWSADYVATLEPGADTLDLECWATVTNRTGTDYPNAKIVLVAGSPNRAANMRGRFQFGAGGVDFSGFEYKLRDTGTVPMLREKARVMEPQATGELYSYPVKSAATIAQEQMNRVKMIHGPRVEIKKDYSVALPTLGLYDGYYGWGTKAQPKRQSAQVAISFYNKEKDGLGLPLPRGAIRVYEPDKTGSLRYVGAAGIQDTPKDAKASLTLSDVFDVYTEGRIVSSKKVAKKRYQKQVEVVLHNEKAAAVELRLVQNLYGKWTIVNESHKSGKLNASSNQWKVSVPAGGETTLKYTVEFTG